MKQLYLSVLLMLLAFGSKAQQNNEPAVLHYYFGQQKIFLAQNIEKIYLRFRPGAMSGMKKNLLDKFQLPEKSYSTLQDDETVLIDLKKEKNSSRSREILQVIKSGGQAIIARPALIANDGKNVVIDEGFYVKLKTGNSYTQLANLAMQKNCVIEKAYPYNNKTYLLKAGAANQYDGLKMANEFFESGLFEYAEPDFRLLDALTSVPNDPLFNLQWSAINTGAANQGNGTVGADIDLDEAWDITMGNAAIKIAVLDEGIQRSHPDLINNIAPVGFGLIAGNATTGEILSSARTHGTSCAGIIAAEANNNIGIAGVAPLSKLVPVNITVNTSGTFGSSAQLALATDWAWNEGGADILSNSWGGGTASSLIQDAIRRAITSGRGGKGSIVVFASGNNNAGLSSPACFPETIAVGAMSMCHQRKSGTSCDNETFWGGNYGTGLDISAPGVRIATTRNTGTGTAPNVDYNLAFNGTSSATPVVAGVAALVLSINNNFTQAQVREIIERSARKAGPYTYGFAPGQPNGSWTSELGHGMVNAKNAVLAAQNPAFCRVEVSATGSLQVCSAGTVPLQVTNHSSGNTYQWRRDGNIVGIGLTHNASQSGNYDVVLTSSTGCRDTSYAFPIIVSPAQGALVADAGRDTAICQDAKLFLGGGPAGAGGTGILHPMRAMAIELNSNSFLRFDPVQPSLYYRTIKTTFIAAPVTDEFHSGAASTPYGLYMINRITKMFEKIDTATGAIFPVGLTTSNNISFAGMTYDPSTGKIFATGLAGTTNHLYEINRTTGAGTFVAAITGIAASNLLISLSADNSGQLYGMRLSTVVNSSAQLMAINKTTGAATVVGNTGFLANFAQSGDVDPLTDELYQVAGTAVLGSNANYSGKGLWKLSKTNGFATLVGSVAQPFNTLDALSFANKEYKYQWSPATNLSNANDANPQFTGTNTGTFTYTLTVTDLCGNTATDQVTITVNALPPAPSINPANPVLSHRNEFRETLTYAQQGGLNYTWVENGGNLANTTNSLPISFLQSPFSQYTVRVSDPVTGCVSNSNPVSFTYATGVLLNNNNALTVCDSSFYDAGGSTGSTGNNFTRTFTPATPGTRLKLSIYNLDLASFATLFVYDGPTTSSPRIEALDNTFNGSVKREYTASNPDGVLTVRFAAGSFQTTGWLAGLTCEQPLEYRSTSNGNWITTSTWESKLPAATSWTPATRLPNKGDDLITVRHEVSLNQPVQTDDVVVTSTGKLNITGTGSVNLFRVKPVTEMLVQQGGSLQLGSSSYAFGGGTIELQGNLQNEGSVTVEELIVNGNGAQQLTNTTGGASSIRKLVMNNAAGLTVQGMHNVEILELTNGLINTSANNTLCLDNTSPGNANAYVNGVVRFLGRSGMNKIIPIGKNGAYRPVNLSASSADGEASATLQAEVITGAPAVRTFPAGISNVSNIRYYQVSAIENSVNLRDFHITLPYGTDDGVADHSILKIAKDNGAGDWINLGGTASGPTPGTIESDQFNGFSDFVLANVVAGPVPVTLVSFSGRLENNQSILKWTAENEINFARYEIERSINGTAFTTIGSKIATGAAATFQYDFLDDQLPAGNIFYYRLRMINTDGSYRYSNIVQLRKEVIAQSRIVFLAPNPFATTLTVQYESAATEKIEAMIINSKGQSMKRIHFNVTQGTNQLYINGSEWAAGVYLLRLKTNTQIITQKIIKE